MTVPFFILATPRHRRKRRESASPPPPPPFARIIEVWLEDTQTINVRFDQPIIVAGGSTTDVGAWVVEDSIAGTLVPIEMDQIDVDVIWFIVPTDMTSGTIGYSGGNVGALTSADGFGESDSHGY